MLCRVNVFGHYIVVRPVKQQLAQELDRLPLYNIVVALDEHVVVFEEELVKVGLEVGRDHFFVLDEDFLQAKSVS
jgi:hypothetical protein